MVKSAADRFPSGTLIKLPQRMFGKIILVKARSQALYRQYHDFKNDALLYECNVWVMVLRSEQATTLGDMFVEFLNSDGLVYMAMINADEEVETLEQLS